MNATLNTLKDWSERGWLRRLDSALADFVLAHDPQADATVLVASALVSHMEGRGHVCLPMADLVRQPQAVLAWPEKAQTELNTLWARLPTDLQVWTDALAHSPVVRCAMLDVKEQPSAAGATSHKMPSNIVGARPCARMRLSDSGQPLVLGGTPEAPLLYLRRYWVYEQQVAQAVSQRAAAQPDVDTAAAKAWLDRLFDSPPAGTEPAQPQWQKIACALALRSGLTVITGGPGTGKTYTAARLLALLLATSPNPAQLRVALAAPTGKAAARLRQSIDLSLVSLQSSLGAAVDLQALTERMGKASTVHALLGMHAGSRQFKHNAQHPLDLDVLIVDETSMVHLEMMAALLQAMPPHAKLVLLGDKDQLASVEAGSVLGDLCAHAQDTRYNPDTCAYVLATCGEHLSASASAGSALDQQTVMLRHSHRFGSDIGALAKAVNAGVAQADAPVDLFAPPAPLGAYALLTRGTQQALSGATATDDNPTPGKVFLVPAPVKPDAVLQLALHGRALAPACYADYLREIQAGPTAQSAQTTSDTPDDQHSAWVKRVLKAFDGFRILCAVHDGHWGDRTINQQVQQALARQGWLRPEGEWFAGRPVMVTRNDKALGVFNGDVGVVLPGQASPALRAWFLDGEQLRSVSVSRLAHVETAFAMTIHKSQGSEFSHTVVVLPDAGGDILTRELVYTGITRAKDHLTLVEPRAGLLGEAMARQVQRASGLGVLATGVVS
jgi:exodeoxyribonuclease V alpha subunit